MKLGSPTAGQRPIPHLLFLIDPQDKHRAKEVVLKTLFYYHFNVDSQFTWGFQHLLADRNSFSRLDRTCYAFTHSALHSFANWLDNLESAPFCLDDLVFIVRRILVQINWNDGPACEFQSPIKRNANVHLLGQAPKIRNQLFILAPAGLVNHDSLDIFVKEFVFCDLWNEITDQRLSISWIDICSQRSHTPESSMTKQTLNASLRVYGGNLMEYTPSFLGDELSYSLARLRRKNHHMHFVKSVLKNPTSSNLIESFCRLHSTDSKGISISFQYPSPYHSDTLISIPICVFERKKGSRVTFEKNNLNYLGFSSASPKIQAEFDALPGRGENSWNSLTHFSLAFKRLQDTKHSLVLRIPCSELAQPENPFQSNQKDEITTGEHRIFFLKPTQFPDTLKLAMVHQSSVDEVLSSLIANPAESTGDEQAGGDDEMISYWYNKWDVPLMKLVQEGVIDQSFSEKIDNICFGIWDPLSVRYPQATSTTVPPSKSTFKEPRASKVTELIFPEITHIKEAFLIFKDFYTAVVFESVRDFNLGLFGTVCGTDIS
jgi:hypothetical protein